MIKKILPAFLLVIILLIFFWQAFVKGFLPIPSDTIVGLYYPFRDIYAKTNPNGIPFKNFLITDPVRQTFPWKNLAVSVWKNLELPVWNPYNFSGTPLLANFQSAVFYPFNLLFFFLPFSSAWAFLIILEPILAGIFLYLYLDNLKLRKEASILGSIAFSFSGFFVAWLEWGTVLHTALWLPLVFLSIDKMVQKSEKKKFPIWELIFIFSLTFSFFAGHLQTFFYLAIFSTIYFLARWVQFGKSVRNLVLFITLIFLFIVFTFVQWFPTLQYILLSARNVDVIGFSEPGWFIPWQNLVQFVAPDFFGNPSTLNYYGIWNYAEFVGYIGIFPLIMAIYAMFFRKDRKTLFFGIAFFVSLFFALPSFISEIPFKLQIPFLSTSQPTRLIFIADFSLAILSALGLDYFLRSENRKKIYYVLGIFAVIFISLWGFVLLYRGGLVSAENLFVSRQNLILPTILFIVFSVLIVATTVKRIWKNRSYALNSIFYILLIITVFDLFRFGWKFESFSDQKYLFPDTKITNFLKSQPGIFRVMSSDSTIFPPNFSIMYKIQTLDGYDPLYLMRFGELMAAIGRGKPDISTPFGFNRIITPQNYSLPIIDLLNIKYVLSTRVLSDPKLSEVLTDGNTKIYMNNSYFERSFFVEKTNSVATKQEAIEKIFDPKFSLTKNAVVEDKIPSEWTIGTVGIVNYQENKIILESKNEGDGFLVLTDAYFPFWHAKIDGKETKIYLTDYTFRGIIVSKGNHKIEFYNSLF